ncbi:DUF4060 family protein [Citrobacter freundii]|uniref:DUF4060 family protein n=1 Tax=Citrobacter freundii TaxID=546 RepID=UPI003C12B9D8
MLKSSVNVASNTLRPCTPYLLTEKKVTVEVITRRRSYVATAMTGVRNLRRLPGIADF